MDYGGTTDMKKRPPHKLQYMAIEVLQVAIQEYLEKRRVTDTDFQVVEVNGGVVFDIVFPR